MNKLNLDKTKITMCREQALKVAIDVQSFIDKNTTLSVERTVLRMLGIDGVDSFGIPIPNRIVDDVLVIQLKNMIL